MIKKILVVLAPTAALLAFAVALTPVAASGHGIHRCPPGVTDHKYCQKCPPGVTDPKYCTKCPPGVTDQKYCTKETHCVVPELRGDSLGKARDALFEHHCTVGEIHRIRGSDVETGHVLFSDPEAGKIRRNHFAVDLYVRKSGREHHHRR